MEITPKKILLCEDHQIVIDGLLSIFKKRNDYCILDYVKNGNDVISLVESSSPDIILLDLNLPNKNGIILLKEIKNNFPKIKIIVLTMYNKESVVNEVIKHGGDGFLLKNCSTEELIGALDFVFKSNVFYRGKGIAKVSPLSENDAFYKKIKITRREKEIVYQLIQGLSVPQISKKLFISAHTVEAHKKNIFKKLNIHNSIDLVKFANESNLFS
jgi:two-component system, NarL family, nitrate/nitrite response regulator NarL